MRVLSVLLLMFAGQGTSVPIAPATVQGRVLDSTTGLPVNAATVELQGHTVPGGPSYFLSRDTVDDGTFNFPYVPPGDYAVEASGAGYVPATAQPQRLTLKPGQSLGGMQISLTPGAVIYGRAVDDRGDPVVGGIVQALRITYRAGRRDRIVVGSVVSNDLGEYRLFRLLPGEYQVSVIDLSRTERASVEWFYPGTVDPSEAQVITLRAGEVIGGIGLPSVPTRGRRVSGSVQGAGGYGVSVILASRSTNLRMERTADPDTGGFVFNGVPPGAYTLAAHTTQLRANLPLEVRGADILNARITLVPGVSVPVRVQIDGRGNGPDPELERLFLELRGELDLPGSAPDKYSPFEDGRLIFDLLPGLSYSVELSQPRDWFIKSMTLGDQDVLSQGLRVSSSSDVPLNIIVGTNPGSVSGRVSGQGVTVVLVPDVARRNQRALYKSARPNASGEFQFSPVAPGDYKVFASREENGGPWLDPDYLHKVEDRATPIRVEPGKKTVVDGSLP